MPVFVVKADGVARGNVGIIEHGQRVELHVALYIASVSIQLVELACKLDRALETIGDQAFDADRHVGQAPGVDARTDRETEIARTGQSRIFTRDLKQRRDTGEADPDESGAILA